MTKIARTELFAIKFSLCVCYVYVTYDVLTIKTKLFMYKKSKGEKYVKGSSHLKPVNVNFDVFFLHLG